MIKKLFKFGVSGASAAIVNLSIFFLLEHVYHIKYFAAVVVSTVCALVFHFILQKFWVFSHNASKQMKSESILFFILGGVNLLFNEALLVLFVHFINLIPIIAQFISLGLLAIMNYFLYERLIFSKERAFSRRVHSFCEAISLRHVLVVIAMCVWLAAHWWGVVYGTRNIPLHQSYVGDEQAPVNGALHILKDKNPLAVYNLKTLYYGPVFAIIALPAVAGDFAIKYFKDEINTAEEYKQSLLWDWGGIIINARVIAVCAGFIGIIAAFMLARTRTFNPSGNAVVPYLTALLIGTNFYFFEYSHFFKHWIFIISLFLMQLYVIAKICDEADAKKRKKWWMSNALIIALSFGISYTSLFFQLIWTGLFIIWFKDKQKHMMKEWFLSMCLATVGMVLFFLWHPYALLRIFRGGAMIPFGEEKLGFIYFGALLVLNHAGYFVAGALMLFVSIRNKLFSRTSFALLFGLCAVGVFQYMLFSAQPGLNREGRYMLPTIICFLLAFAYVFGVCFSSLSIKKSLYTIVITTMVFTLGFHVVHIGKWIDVYAQGPVEQRMLEALKDSSNENDRILLVQYYIAGAPHTNEAYQDYMDRFGRSEVNLFKELLVSQPLSSAERINAYYIRPDMFKVEDMRGYDKVILLQEPRHEINQFDYFDQSLVRLWWHTMLSPTYHVIK